MNAHEHDVDLDHDDDHEHDDDDPSCEVAHGTSAPAATGGRSLVAVYATPLASCLLRWGAELGFHTTLVDPGPEHDPGGDGRGGVTQDGVALDDVLADELAAADVVVADPAQLGSVIEVGAHTDIVVTDHHRGDLGEVMAPLVSAGPRWIGIIGSPRHEGPHVAALRAEGSSEAEIATVHRPIGVDIGSKTPPEIALSVLAGLLADRNGRDAGLPARSGPPAVATTGGGA